MRISAKVECGIIALLDIALNTNNESTVKVNAISKRNNISAKYLEQNATDAIKKCLWEPITSYLCKYTKNTTLKDLTDMYYVQKNYNDDISFIKSHT